VPIDPTRPLVRISSLKAHEVNCPDSIDRSNTGLLGQ
jgi:hypothetical protein